MGSLKCPRCEKTVYYEDGKAEDCWNCGLHIPAQGEKQIPWGASTAPPEPDFVLPPPTYATTGGADNRTLKSRAAKRKAGWALGLVIAGLVVPFVGLILWVIGLSMAHSVANEMDRRRWKNGRRLATAAKVVGWGGLILVILAVVLAAVVFVLVNDLGDEAGPTPTQIDALTLLLDDDQDGRLELAAFVVLKDETGQPTDCHCVITFATTGGGDRTLFSESVRPLDFSWWELTNGQTTEDHYAFSYETAEGAFSCSGTNRGTLFVTVDLEDGTRLSASRPYTC